MASDEASDVVVDSLAASEEEAGALSLAVELLPLVAVLPQAARLTVMQPAASRAAARFMVLRFIFRSLLLL